MAYRNKTGKCGEDLASCVLESKGYIICARNFSCRIGEVDIICFKDDEIHFVEVKTRTDNGLQYPAEAVDRRKQDRIRHIAEYYMMINRIRERTVVFDVIGIEIECIEDCF